MPPGPVGAPPPDGAGGAVPAGAGEGGADPGGPGPARTPERDGAGAPPPLPHPRALELAERELRKVASRLFTKRAAVEVEAAASKVAGHTDRIRRRRESAVWKAGAAGSEPPLLADGQKSKVARGLKVMMVPGGHRSWCHTEVNVLPKEVTRKMFVDNELGETVPVVDSEDEEMANAAANLKEPSWTPADDLLVAGLFRWFGGSLPGLEAAHQGLQGKYWKRSIALRIGVLSADRDQARDALAYGSTNLPKDGDPRALLDERMFKGHSSLESALDSFSQLFCWRCRRFDCKSHGPGSEMLPRHTKAPAAAAEVPAGGGEGGPPAGAGAGEVPACKSRRCFRGAPAVGGAEGAYAWTPLETDLLEKGLDIFRARPCKLALLLRKPAPAGGPEGATCADVHRKLLEWGYRQDPTAPDRLVKASAVEPAARGDGKLEGGSHIPTEEVQLMQCVVVPEQPKGGKGKKQVKPTKAARKRFNLNTIRKRQKGIGESGVWPQYEPCDCHARGLPCKKGVCPCSEVGNFCERFCACACADCVNRLQGCNCKMGDCGTRACPCFSAGRECDPDVCRMCHVEVTAEGTLKCKCKNMQLRLQTGKGQSPAVRVGFSNVAGLGCFLVEGKKKGEYIGEYTGEVVSQFEADRRGKIYDQLNAGQGSSYLFNLNDRNALDAETRGSALRFANHSTNPNCIPKVVLVDSEHRVAIFAKKDIPAGTELFYDYRYEDDKAPEWAKRGGDL